MKNIFFHVNTELSSYMRTKRMSKEVFHENL